MANVYQHGQLRGARRSVGLTQADLAERLAEIAWWRDRVRVGVNADMVAKWERGSKTPARIYQQLLCVVFDMTAAELGLAAVGSTPDAAARGGSSTPGIPWAEVLLALGAPGQLLHPQLIDEWEDDLVKRRELLKSMGLGALATSLGALPMPFTGPAWRTQETRSDTETIDALGQLAASYQRLYHGTAPQILMAPIRAHLRTVDELLRHSAAHTRGSLLMNQAQVALLAGRLTLFDLRDSLSARGYLAMAHDSAIAAGDSSLAAAALGHLSFVPASSGQAAVAADYVNRALTHADRGASASVQSWLFAVASECRANSGEPAGSLAAIDDAKLSLERSSESPQPPWFDFYDESRLAGFEGYALVKAGSPEPARRVLDFAVTGLPRDATKQRAIFRADLATANLRQGNVDEACGQAMEAAAELRTARYATCVQRLRQLRSTMRPYETSRAVRDLDHAIVDL